MRAAPSLQKVLAAAIAEGGWFDTAHEQAVREAVGEADPDDAAARGAHAAGRGDPAGDARRRRGRLRARPDPQPGCTRHRHPQED